MASRDVEAGNKCCPSNRKLVAQQDPNSSRAGIKMAPVCPLLWGRFHHPILQRRQLRLSMLKQLAKAQQGQDSTPGWVMQSSGCFLYASLPFGYLWLLELLSSGLSPSNPK